MKLRPESIKNRIDLVELISKYATSCALEMKDDKFENIKVGAYVNVFSAQDLDNFIDEIVNFTYEETFKMIKRNMENI
jgi:hypothetical protein